METFRSWIRSETNIGDFCTFEQSQLSCQNLSLWIFSYLPAKAVD